VVVEIAQQIGTTPFATVMRRDAKCSYCQHDRAGNHTQPGWVHVSLLMNIQDRCPILRAARTKNISGLNDSLFALDCRSAYPRYCAQDCVAARRDAGTGKPGFRQIVHNQLERAERAQLGAVRLDASGRVLHQQQRGDFVRAQHGVSLPKGNYEKADNSDYTSNACENTKAKAVKAFGICLLSG
jgi:hypothetical protein